MSAKDVKPTRLEAAQVVVRDFLGDLPEKFQVGVVSFSEQAEVVTPATDDRDLATYAINYLYPQRGTAIGDGLARGVEVARAASPRGPTKNRPAAILLLSDGSQTEGLLLPLAGRRAREVVRHPDLHDRARHARGRRRVQPLRDEPHHPRAARSGDAQGRSRRRRAAASTRPRAPATCARRTSGSARSSARSSASRRSPTRSSAPASCCCSRPRRSASSPSRGCRESACARARWASLALAGCSGGGDADEAATLDPGAHRHGHRDRDGRSRAAERHRSRSPTPSSACCRRSSYVEDADLRRRQGRGLRRRHRPERDHRHEQPRDRGHDEGERRLQRRAPPRTARGDGHRHGAGARSRGDPRPARPTSCRSPWATRRRCGSAIR